MKKSIQSSPAFWISAAFMVLLIPLNWLTSILFAALIHEGCHLLMIRLCGIRIDGFQLGAAGAVIQMDSPNRGKEILCALAGPVGGLLLLFLLPLFPRIAICGLVQSVFNLLPVYPLDGGRALRCSAELLFPASTADRICKTAKLLVFLAAALLCWYAFFVLHMGLTPLVLLLILLSRISVRKTACKPEQHRVQYIENE